jgi:hypothetical protein
MPYEIVVFLEHNTILYGVKKKKLTNSNIKIIIILSSYKQKHSGKKIEFYSFVYACDALMICC